MYKGSPGYRIRQDAKRSDSYSHRKGLFSAIADFFNRYFERRRTEQDYARDNPRNRPISGGQKESGLRKLMSLIAIISVIGGIFFIISNFISSGIHLSPGSSVFSPSSGLIAGVLMILLGLVFSFLKLRKR